jgi:hypothetical protein
MRHSSAHTDHGMSVAPALGYAIWRAENLSKFSFCLDTHRFRQLSYLGCKQRLALCLENTHFHGLR